MYNLAGPSSPGMAKTEQIAVWAALYFQALLLFYSPDIWSVQILAGGNGPMVSAKPEQVDQWPVNGLIFFQNWLYVINVSGCVV